MQRSSVQTPKTNETAIAQSQVFERNSMQRKSIPLPTKDEQVTERLKAVEPGSIQKENLQNTDRNRTDTNDSRLETEVKDQ